MPKNLQKIQKALAKDKINNQPVEIRDLVAFQLNERMVNDPSQVQPMGEFSADSISTPQFDHSRVSKESEDEVIARMLAHLTDLITIAAKYHLADNFSHAEQYISFETLHALGVKKAQSVQENKVIKAMNIILEEQKLFPTLDPKKNNRVTRLTMNEFSLYPHKERGPLSVTGFEKLLKKIDIIARFNPENLDLILGTVPIKIKEGQIQNMAVFVQCGKFPVLQVFSKAIPSAVDPIYPHYENIYFSPALVKNKIFDELNKMFEDLYNKIVALDFSAETYKKITNFKKLCYQNKKILAIPQALDDLIQKLETHKYSHSLEVHSDLKKFRTLTQTYFYDLANSMLRQKIKFIPSASVTEGGAVMNYGGNIICKTAGGSKYRTVIDICLDHNYAVGKHLMLQEVDRARYHGEAHLPLRASHVVISNSISINKANLITQSSVQSDPLVSAQLQSFKGPGDKYIQAEQRLALTSPKFGSITILDFCSYQTLSHAEGIDAVITDHNHFQSKLAALHMYRSQQTSNLIAINVQINEHILSPIFELLKKSKTLSKNISSLKLLITDHAKIITILDELLNQSLSKKLHKEISIAIHLLKQEQSIIVQIQSNGIFRKKITDAANIQTILDVGHVKFKSMTDIKSDLSVCSSTEIMSQFNKSASITSSTEIMSQFNKSASITSSTEIMSQFNKSASITSVQYEKNKSAKNDASINASVYSPKSGSTSTFLQPLGFIDKLEMLKVVVHYASGFFPWNRISKLSDQQIYNLQKISDDIMSIQRIFNNIESSLRENPHSHYKFIVESPKYQEARRVFEQNQNALIRIQKRAVASNSQMNEIENNITYLKSLMSEIMSKTTKTQARKLNTQEKRQKRRLGKK